MGPVLYKLILTQGYSDQDICNCKSINMLVRWTPLACACFGSLGVYLHSSKILIALGLFTLIGAITNRSFYDYLYLFFVRPIFKTEDIPRHGNQRRFGCGVGAFLFLTSGIGFATGNLLLAYISAGIIITLAFIAAVTQWCFASTLYNFLFPCKT